MDDENPNEPKRAGEPDQMSTEDQMQKDSLSRREEETIPWAEIIVEPEQERYAPGEENLASQESAPAHTSFGSGLFSRLHVMLAEGYAHGPLEGPPLAVLAVILLAFILWMSK